MFRWEERNALEKKTLTDGDGSGEKDEKDSNWYKYLQQYFKYQWKPHQKKTIQAMCYAFSNVIEVW